MFGTIPIIPKTVFTLFGASSGTQTIPLVTQVRSDLWVTGQLVVRFHSGAIVTNANAKVVVENATYSADDPSQVFQPATSSITIASVTLDTTTLARHQLQASFAAANLGPSVRVILQFTNSTAGSASTFGISVDLVARSA